MDQRIVAGSQAQVSEANFISKVYLWMSLSLFLSAFASFWLLTQPTLLKMVATNLWAIVVLFFIEIGLVVWLSKALTNLSAVAAISIFCGFAFVNGLMLAPIFLDYTGASIATTFGITAGTFLFFSIYGMTTKKDLTTVGRLAMMGLFGIIIASVVNFFLKSSAVMWITTYIGIAVFLGLIAYDTQKLKAMHAMGAENEEMGKKLAIMGALALYLDFINLFMMLLRIFGRRRD